MGRRRGWGDAVGGNYGFLTFLAGPRGCVVDVFVKVAFKRPLAPTISRCELEGGDC